MRKHKIGKLNRSKNFACVLVAQLARAMLSFYSLETALALHKTPSAFCSSSHCDCLAGFAVCGRFHTDSDFSNPFPPFNSLHAETSEGLGGSEFSRVCTIEIKQSAPAVVSIVLRCLLTLPFHSFRLPNPTLTQPFTAACGDVCF